MLFGAGAAVSNDQSGWCLVGPYQWPLPEIGASLGPYAATMLAPAYALSSPLWLPSSKTPWACMPLVACPRLAVALHAPQPHVPVCIPETRTTTACPPGPLRRLE
ncbi:hypothetical protein V6N13_061715 [Hibiscus sabdariffa]